VLCLQQHSLGVVFWWDWFTWHFPKVGDEIARLDVTSGLADRQTWPPKDPISAAKTAFQHLQSKACWFSTYSDISPCLPGFSWFPSQYLFWLRGASEVTEDLRLSLLFSRPFQRPRSSSQVFRWTRLATGGRWVKT